MYEIMSRSQGSRIGICILGDLSAEEIRNLRSTLRKFAWRFGSLSLLCVIEEWSGWEGLEALWEDLKTDVALNREIERLAMVGKATVGRWTTKVMEPFAHAEVRWFPISGIEEGWSWICEGAPAGESGASTGKA